MYTEIEIQPDIIGLIKTLKEHKNSRKDKKNIRILNIENGRVEIFVGRGVFLRDFDPPKLGERIICFSKDKNDFVDPLVYGYVVRLAEKGLRIFAYPCCPIKTRGTYGDS